MARLQQGVRKPVALGRFDLLKAIDIELANKTFKFGVSKIDG